MWLPNEWWIELKKSGPTWTFTAGVADLIKIKSSAKFRWQKEANREAINALRLMAYDIRDVGWTKFRCHSRIPGTHRAFCGAQVGDSPNLQNYGSEPCGNCYRILESIQDSDKPETDVKKHFRYISFNSERIPVGLQQALENLKGERKMDSEKMLKTEIPDGAVAHNKAPLGCKPDWEIIPKRKPRRMSYDDVFQVITKYAHEMQRPFADKFSRFPEGGNAAMIVNYLNDKADFYRTIDENIANDLVDAAGEIIVRCG